MSSFTDPLVVEKISARLWKTHRPLTYYVGQIEDNDVIVVPEGFITDFASVPQFAWIMIPPDGEYTAAAVVHDYLYSTQTRTRKQSDDIFLEAMEVLKVVFWKRILMYWAVRLFAWIAWNKHKENLKK